MPFLNKIAYFHFRVFPDMNEHWLEWSTLNYEHTLSCLVKYKTSLSSPVTGTTVSERFSGQLMKFQTIITIIYLFLIVGDTMYHQIYQQTF